MKISLLLIGLLWRFSTLAQPITGRWEAEEVSLEITSILNYGIVAMKQPRQATKPAKNRLIAEFLPDGTFRMNTDSGTYRQQGNEIHADVNGKTEVYTVYRTGDQLQLWGPNLVASQSQQNRTATALMLVRQMGMQGSFAYLQPTDRVSSVTIGTHPRNYPSPNTPTAT